MFEIVLLSALDPVGLATLHPCSKLQSRACMGVSDIG